MATTAELPFASDLSLDMGHAGCRDVLVMATDHLGWKATLNHGGTIIWADTESEAQERLSRLRRGDWLSWIPGVQEACGKVALDTVMQERSAPFWPRSWSASAQNVEAVCSEAFQDGVSTVIVKPDRGSQGVGISLARTREELRRHLVRLGPEMALVQQYIERPMLIDGCKWDARLYVLLMPNPEGGHAVFLAEEGLVRVCPEAYEQPTRENLQRTSVHLTNYSLSKFSKNYDYGSNPDAGCKRLLSTVLQRLESTSTAALCAADVRSAIGRLARETGEAISGQLAVDTSDHRLGRCFHLLGLDVILDEHGRAWLLEANYRPALLIDEVHPLSCSQSRADLNRLFAAERRSSAGTGQSRWGRPCRCSLHPSAHEHQICAVDVASKQPAVEGAMIMVARARAGEPMNTWTAGSGYRQV